MFKEIEGAVTWFDQHKDHPLQDAAKAALDATDAQAAKNKANPQGIILDLPGVVSDVVHNAIGDRLPVVQPQDNNLGLPGLDNETPAPDTRPVTLRAPAPVPTAFRVPDAYNREMRARRVGPATPSATDAIFTLGSLEKPVLHLSGTLKTAADAIADGIRPAAFHPAALGASLSAGSPGEIIAAAVKEGTLAAFRELAITSDLSKAEGRAATAYDSADSRNGGAPNLRYGHRAGENAAAGVVARYRNTPDSAHGGHRLPFQPGPETDAHTQFRAHAARGMSDAGRERVNSWMGFFMKADAEGGMGLPRGKAAAMVAMMQGESGQNLDPAIFNPNDNGGPSGGSAQWHDKAGEVNGRLTQLKRFAAARKTDWRDVSLQQQFWKHEAQTSERAAWNKIQSAPDGPSALHAGVFDYERPADRPGEYRKRLPNLDRIMRGDFNQQPQPAARLMAEAAGKLKSAAIDQGRTAAIQRRDIMGDRSDRMLSPSREQGRPAIAPLPGIAPEPKRLDPTAGPRAQMDPLHIHLTHQENGRTRVAARHGEGVKLSIRTAPTLVQTG